jgi:ribosomal protein S18 acetylase RimI-like enzyme
MAEIAPSANELSSAVLAETDIPALISKLHELLPYPIPLYRRLQFHLKHPNTATARAFLALASHTSPQAWLSSAAISSTRETAFFAAHIDLSCAGETQIYVFASWELPTSNGFVQPTEETKKSLLNALFKTLATDPTFIPSSPKSPPSSHQLLMQTKKLVTRYSPSKILFGALHTEVFILIPKNAHARTDAGFVKYIFHPSQNSLASSGDEQLPTGYCFGTINDNDDHLNLVLSRTVIPRTLVTMRQLGSVGVFYDGETYATVAEVENDQHTTDEKGRNSRTAREVELSTNTVDAAAVAAMLEKINRQPVAWGFLGKDASLTSLHVEPRHRGKGLAGDVTRKLFAMQDEVFGAGTRLGHADVFESNSASRRVMEKLGGRSTWVVVWVEEVSSI